MKRIKSISVGSFGFTPDQREALSQDKFPQSIDAIREIKMNMWAIENPRFPV